MSNFESLISGPPAGLTARVFAMDWEEPPVPFAGSTLPAYFQILVRTDPWPDSLPEQWGDDQWGVDLLFRVIPGRDTSELHEAASNRDLAWALDQLRKKWPMSTWKTYGHLILMLGIQQERPPALESWQRWDIEYATQTADPSLVTQAASRLARAQPKKRRRTEITAAHLAAVAEVYLAAPSKPTTTVSKHFQVAHSTAARWVVLARKADLIPPVTE